VARGVAKVTFNQYGDRYFLSQVSDSESRMEVANVGV
jgi:hypothetical protein